MLIESKIALEKNVVGTKKFRKFTLKLHFDETCVYIIKTGQVLMQSDLISKACRLFERTKMNYVARISERVELRLFDCFNTL